MLFILLCSSGFSQDERTIEGTVTGATDGLPIPGANVIIRGTNTGVVTDFDGSYSIIASAGYVLIFSYVGYKTEEIGVEDQVTINVALTEDCTQRDVVTLTGIGY